MDYTHVPAKYAIFSKTAIRWIQVKSTFTTTCMCADFNSFSQPNSKFNLPSFHLSALIWLTRIHEKS